jgi:hypothetical protein
VLISDRCELPRSKGEDMTAHRVGDLEIQQDIDFQQREWRIQRVAWIVMFCILVAAVVGLFGHGPTASATRTDAGGRLQIDYDRFDRIHAPTRFRIRLGAGTAVNGEVRLWVARTYLDRVDVRSIVPEPESTEAGADRVIFVFGTDDPDRPAVVTFHFEHDRIGLARGEVGLIDGPTIAFRQVVYP